VLKSGVRGNWDTFEGVGLIASVDEEIVVITASRPKDVGFSFWEVLTKVFNFIIKGVVRGQLIFWEKQISSGEGHTRGRGLKFSDTHLDQML